MILIYQQGVKWDDLADDFKSGKFWNAESK